VFNRTLQLAALFPIVTPAVKREAKEEPMALAVVGVFHCKYGDHPPGVASAIRPAMAPA
jgi:hypothetical protein